MSQAQANGARVQRSYIMSNVFQPPTKHIEADDLCPVCYDSLKSDACETICGHVFHADCLKGWYDTKMAETVYDANDEHQTRPLHIFVCPTCRRELKRRLAGRRALDSGPDTQLALRIMRWSGLLDGTYMAGRGYEVGAYNANWTAELQHAFAWHAITAQMPQADIAVNIAPIATARAMVIMGNLLRAELILGQPDVFDGAMAMIWDDLIGDAISALLDGSGPRIIAQARVAADALCYWMMATFIGYNRVTRTGREPTPQIELLCRATLYLTTYVASLASERQFHAWVSRNLRPAAAIN